jgi:hypothetical protein
MNRFQFAFKFKLRRYIEGMNVLGDGNVACIERLRAGAYTRSQFSST